MYRKPLRLNKKSLTANVSNTGIVQNCGITLLTIVCLVLLFQLLLNTHLPTIIIVLPFQKRLLLTFSDHGQTTMCSTYITPVNIKYDGVSIQIHAKDDDVDGDMEEECRLFKRHTCTYICKTYNRYLSVHDQIKCVTVI